MKLSVFVILIFLLQATRTTLSANNNCCENEKNLLVDNRCDVSSEGHRPKIRLECEEKYILDPANVDDDAYTLTENGTLHVPDMASYLLPDEFCLVNSFDEELNETVEIAIVCFPDPDTEIAKISYSLKAIFLMISIVFLLLTLYIYYELPELRETQDKVTICTVVCLTCFMFFLACLQLYVPDDLKFDLCLYLAMPTYFFTIAYFSWLNCVIVNVWKLIVLRRWKINENHWYLLNHVYGWTVPIVMLIIVNVKHYFKPNLGVSTCWFHHNHDQWTLVYLPISIMLGLNVLFCIWSSIYLSRSDYTPDTLKALRYKCILYLKIFLLGGFTWIFEVLSYVFNDHSPTAWIWIIVDSLNCLHGALIFCVLILWRQRIRKELANRKILCFTCPSKWADIDDEEQVCLDNEGKGKYDLIIKTIK